MPVRGGESLVQPAFFRNFAGQSTLNHGIGPDLTFTRNSIGTYYDQNGILRTASANVPRFDYDPVTLQPLGLLIEDSATNSLQRSEDFSNAYWTKSNVSVQTAAGISPAGTNTANRIIESFDTTNTVHQIRLFAPTFSAGTYYTLSLFVRELERFNLSVILSNAGDSFGGYAGADFNLATEAINSTRVNGFIKKLSNGWYRIAVSALATVTSSTNLMIFQLRNSLNQNNYIGNGTSGMLFWGAQLEAFQGSFPTSYIPTTNAQITRQLESCVVSPNTFFNSNEGTLYVEAIGIYTGNYNSGLVGFDDGTSNNRIFIRKATTNNCTRGTVLGGVFQNTTSNTANSWPVGTYGKCSYGYQAGNFAGFYNTIGTSSGSQDAVPSNLSIFRVGTSLGSNAANCGIAKVAYWPIRLSNFQLQQLTS